ncbi:AraC family transcriptional regulator [Phenylobacterium sp.]|uniref:AraC family transcriptional regulator n=1 Tax=Phenylobacterium sp. TaxID=1871053 RepID=UPI0025EF7ACC|nr:AraC family transcriptional regulator [Phenylobacterium sp.]
MGYAAADKMAWNTLASLPTTHLYLVSFPQDAAGGNNQVAIHRWEFDRAGPAQGLASSSDEHIVSISLRATRLELRSGAGSVFDGVMPTATIHLTGPGQRLVANISGPCDILHLKVPTRFLHQRLGAMGAPSCVLDRLNACTLSDAFAEQLAELLVSAGARTDPVYAMAIVQTLLTRVLHMAQSRTPTGALAKWRLRRVQALIDASLAEPLSLGDLAAAAGLSRMHFAAQFRAATGFSPHEYLRCRRVEAAKALLAETEISLVEIALQVGFLAQAHFTTVFKRLTTTTPAQWRRVHREGRHDQGEPAPTTPRFRPRAAVFPRAQP